MQSSQIAAPSSDSISRSICPAIVMRLGMLCHSHRRRAPKDPNI